MVVIEIVVAAAVVVVLFTLEVAVVIEVVTVL